MTPPERARPTPRRSGPAQTPPATPARPAPEFPAAPDPLPPTPEFVALCRDFGIALAESEQHTLGRYLALLLDANKAHNLTAIRDPEAAWVRHIFDSLTLLPVLADLPDGASIIDVGSGGGLPGVPLAIALPGLRFTLLEATAKKAAFLSHACGPSGLALANAQVLTARAEAAGRDPAHRDVHDAAVARAVGPLAVIAELSVPLVRAGGLVVLVKGERADEELAAAAGALRLLHTAHAGTVQTPTGRLIVLEKQQRTPKAYPRRDGEPKRAPLGGDA